MTALPNPNPAATADAACRRKMPYGDELSARLGAQAAITARGRAGQPRLWVYQCPTCSRWHLTKQGGGLNARSIAVTARELFEGRS